MKLSDERRELFRRNYEEAAKICSSCTHKCFLYVLITYIDENSFEFFMYQQEHDSLPVEVKIAFDRFWALFGDSLDPDVVSVITPPWC